MNSLCYTDEYLGELQQKELEIKLELVLWWVAIHFNGLNVTGSSFHFCHRQLSTFMLATCHSCSFLFHAAVGINGWGENLSCLHTWQPWHGDFAFWAHFSSPPPGFFTLLCLSFLKSSGLLSVGFIETEQERCGTKNTARSLPSKINEPVGFNQIIRAPSAPKWVSPLGKCPICDIINPALPGTDPIWSSGFSCLFFEALHHLVNWEGQTGAGGSSSGWCGWRHYGEWVWVWRCEMKTMGGGWVDENNGVCSEDGYIQWGQVEHVTVQIC